MISAALANATTPAELHAVMQAMFDAGTSCTYLEACYHTGAALRGEVARYFGEDGRLRDPEAVPLDPFVAGEPFESVSAVVEALHARLETIRSATVSVAHDSPPPKADPVSTICVIGAGAPSDAHTLVAAPAVEDVRFFCQICDKRVDAEPVVFRGKEMCGRCAAKLRGF